MGTVCFSAAGRARPIGPGGSSVGIPPGKVSNPFSVTSTLFHTSPKSPADLARKLQTENLPTYVKSVFAEEEIRRFMSGGAAHWVDRLHMES